MNLRVEGFFQPCVRSLSYFFLININPALEFYYEAKRPFNSINIFYINKIREEKFHAILCVCEEFLIFFIAFSSLRKTFSFLFEEFSKL